MSPALVAFALLFAAGECPAIRATPDAPGLVAVARLPNAEAMRLNSEGKQLYRQERWQEARAKYAAALAADPEMYSARLNLACAFSRQGRYAEAAQEAARLTQQCFVPWDREVEEAADLAILQDQPVYPTLQAARAEAARAWGEKVRGGVYFVARTRPPLKVEGEGTLVLGLSQELFAWMPRSGRYFQLTAEDGRVLAAAPSADGRHVVYMLAGKLVRQPGSPALLRGLSARVLEIPTMTLGPKVSLPMDVRQVQVWYSGRAEMKVVDADGKNLGLRLAGKELLPSAEARRPSNARGVVLTTSGVAPASTRHQERGCAFALAQEKGKDGIWRVRVSRPGGKPFVLDTQYGSGLMGMPFADSQRKIAAEPGQPAQK